MGYRPLSPRPGERVSAAGSVDVEVPDIGDFSDVPVIEILVSPGDVVGVDDPLITLESDKATMDVPAPFAGEVHEIQVAIGDRVSQGSLLLRMTPEENGAGPGPRASAIASEGVPSEAAAPDAVGGALAAEEPLEPAGAAAGAPAEADGGVPAAREQVYASPAARRIARERGDRPRPECTGSGRGGRITIDDVQRTGAGEVASGAAPAAAGGLALAPWPTVDFERYGPVERIPRSRIQRISAPNLHRNWVMIPHVTHHDEADITDLEAWRRELNGELDGVKVTMVAFLVAASVHALKEFPDFNSSLDGDELVRKGYWNIGFAADTPQGLVVPVIRDADRKGIVEIAAELGELSGRARAGKLAPADITGGTFSISSLGGIGGTGVHPDRQRARGRDPRRHALSDEAAVGRSGVRAPADAAALALL